MKIDTGGMAYLLVVYSIEFTLKIDNVQWTLNGLENICQKCYITNGKIESGAILGEIFLEL